MLRAAAVSAGAIALPLLDGRGLTATAVFAGGFYLSDDAGGMLCVLSEFREAGPLHLNCAAWPENAGRFARVGDKFALADGTLRSAAVSIPITGAAVWRPRSLPAAAPTAIRAAHRAIRAAAKTSAPSRTLVAACLHPKKTDSEEISPFLLAEIQKGLLALAERPRDAAEILLGLGPGLTPSGDDILAGALLALRAFAVHGRANRLAESVIPRLERTNRVSAAHLLAADKGQGAAVFHELLAWAVAGGELKPFLARVDRIGHSSGWDALLGMLGALAAISGDSHAREG
ncbi:MAG: DUF2877 domain-containing protein [Planctomycetota bacterium]|jgi:hypothetical protein|nr:DUF2877 domain-containing protein [Planctomycetota bacterium]